LKHWDAAMAVQTVVAKATNAEGASMVIVWIANETQWTKKRDDSKLQEDDAKTKNCRMKGPRR
jgi:hypothetical protein